MLENFSLNFKILATVFFRPLHKKKRAGLITLTGQLALHELELTVVCSREEFGRVGIEFFSFG
jgi:hypothetical protein